MGVSPNRKLPDPRFRKTNIIVNITLCRVYLFYLSYTVCTSPSVSASNQVTFQSDSNMSLTCFFFLLAFNKGKIKPKNLSHFCFTSHTTLSKCNPDKKKQIRYMIVPKNIFYMLDILYINILYLFSNWIFPTIPSCDQLFHLTFIMK